MSAHPSLCTINLFLCTISMEKSVVHTHGTHKPFVRRTKLKSVYQQFMVHGVPCLTNKISRRVDYEPSEDIYILLENYRKHFKLDGFKETLEGFIRNELLFTADGSGIIDGFEFKGEYPNYHSFRICSHKAEKPAESVPEPQVTEGRDTGTRGVPSSQQAQQPKPFNPNLSFAKPQQERTLVCAHGHNFPTEIQCHVCAYNKYCNYSSANKDFISKESV